VKRADLSVEPLHQSDIEPAADHIGPALTAIVVRVDSTRSAQEWPAFHKSEGADEGTPARD